jgi:hypothetical protein
VARVLLGALPMTRRRSRRSFTLTLFLAVLLATGGCNQCNSDGKLNPGGCDGPNSLDPDADPVDALPL